MGVQLGLNKAEKVLAPQKIEFLEGRKVLSVACGVQHSVALVEKLKAPSSDKKSPSSESGRSSDSGLSTRSVTGLSISRSRSGSPVVNNTIQVHKVRPSTCAKCQQEIYTYTETSDACIISTKHRCPLGLDIKTEDAGTDTPDAAAEVESSKSANDESGNDDSSCQSTPDKKTMNISEKHTDRDKNSDSGLSNPETDELDFKKDSSKHVLSSNDAKQAASDKSESDLTDSEHGDSIQLEYIKLDESPLRSGGQEGHGDDTVTEAAGKNSETKPEGSVSEIARRRGKSPDLEPLKSQPLDKGSDTLTTLLGGNKDRSSSVNRTECSITKSRSSFLDENEAKECLEKLLYGDEDPKELGGDHAAEQSEPSSPFVKNIENILQYVPSSPAAVQEYVTNLTKNVVSNIKTSIDRFSFVSSQNSMDLESMSKSSSQDSINLAAGSKTPKEESSGSRSKVEGQVKGKEDDFLGLSLMTRSTSLGSFLKAKMNAERKASLPVGELNLFKGGHFHLLSWDSSTRHTMSRISQSEMFGIASQFAM